MFRKTQVLQLNTAGASALVGLDHCVENARYRRRLALLDDFQASDILARYSGQAKQDQLSRLDEAGTTAGRRSFVTESK
jgi:hypothetical protein